jgi:hypothetical protein
MAAVRYLVATTTEYVHAKLCMETGGKHCYLLNVTNIETV